MNKNRDKPQYGTPTCVRVSYRPNKGITHVVILGGQFDKNLSKSPHADPKPFATIDMIDALSTWDEWEKCWDWIKWANASGWKRTEKGNVTEWRPE